MSREHGVEPEGRARVLTPRDAVWKIRRAMHEPPDLGELLADLESFRVERTESLTNTDKFCKAICAFANDMPGAGLPGYLFIGVDQDGKPTGETIDERLLETLAGHRDNGNILPIPTMHVFKAQHEGADIAVVEVQPSEMPPVRYKQTNLDPYPSVSGQSHRRAGEATGRTASRSSEDLGPSSLCGIIASRSCPGTLHCYLSSQRC